MTLAQANAILRPFPKTPEIDKALVKFGDDWEMTRAFVLWVITKPKKPAIETGLAEFFQVDLDKINPERQAYQEYKKHEN